LHYKLFDLKLTKIEVNKLKILLKNNNGYDLDTNKSILFEIEEFFIKNTNLDKDTILLTIFKFLQNDTKYEPYDLIDNMAKSIWTIYFNDINSDNTILFSLDEFQKKVMSNELDKILYKIDSNEIDMKKIKDLVDFFDKNNNIDNPNKEDLINCINENINTILMFNNLMNSKLEDKDIKIIANIYFTVKLNQFSKLLNLKNYNTKEEAEQLNLLNAEYATKLSFDGIKKISDLPKAKITKINTILDNTKNYLKNILTEYDYEILEFNSSHFGTLYDKKKFNTFVKNIKRVNAHIYKENNIDENNDIFFILVEIYLTKIKIYKVYDDIESLLHIFKSFKRSTKYIPFSICDDSILNLYNFNNLFPKRLINTYLSLVFSIYLNSKYEDTRVLLSKLLLDTKKRIKPTEFAPTKEKKKFENMNINIRTIIEYID